MGITPTFKKEDIEKRFRAFLDVVEKRTLDRLQRLGEECMKVARNNGDYTDQTGNLRSSVGYMIFNNGVAVHDHFKQVVQKNEATGKNKKIGLEGVNVGRKAALEIGSKYKRGYALVVVAGMNYAVAVESGRRKKPDGTYYTATPRDVLTSAEIYAKQMLPVMLEQLKNNISKATKSI